FNLFGDERRSCFSMVLFHPKDDGPDLLISRQTPIQPLMAIRIGSTTTAPSRPNSILVFQALRFSCRSSSSVSQSLIGTTSPCDRSMCGQVLRRPADRPTTVHRERPPAACDHTGRRRGFRPDAARMI